MRSRDGLNLDNIPTDLITLSIQVTDGRNSDEATVRIAVKDVNDRKPQFEQSEYVSSVPENAAIGTVIHHVKATDADFGPNAEISYRYEECAKLQQIEQNNNKKPGFPVKICQTAHSREQMG